MVTSRTSKRSERRLAIALGVVCVACGASQVPVTAVTLPDASRQPDGVVLETPPAVPEVDDHAAVSGIVALRAPLPNEAVITIVHMLFRGFAHGGIEALRAMVTDDVATLGAVRCKGGVLDQWQARLKNHGYSHLVPAEVVDDDRIARFTYEDLGIPGAPERPAAMKQGEILVRFPVATPRVGSDDLFGDQITLLLRREGQGYKIAGVGEEHGPCD